MNTAANELVSILAVEAKLRSVTDDAASRRPAPGKWSSKEILGHLVDSAANNHQRFVRLQLGDRLALPGYAQDDWVRVQHYQEEPWSAIIDIWTAYNNHLVSVIRSIDASTLHHLWRTPGGEEHSLEFLVNDYLRHMRHHLEQIRSRM